MNQGITLSSGHAKNDKRHSTNSVSMVLNPEFKKILYIKLIEVLLNYSGI